MPRIEHTPKLVLTVAAIASLVGAPSAGLQAQVNDDDAGFQRYLVQLGALARAGGVRETTVARMTTGLKLDERVIAIDRADNGVSASAPPMAGYLHSHVTSDRIATGRTMLVQSAKQIARIERSYGVPGPVLLAIWGQETHYGTYTGGFDLVRSLASLAYEGRRRDLFAREFVALLKMADLGVPRSRMKGSYAGALGNPQFLPSVYLRVAVDADGDGVRDIWNSRPDTLGSIANYFREAGWHSGVTWGVGAAVPIGLDRAQLRERKTAITCARARARHSVRKSIADWRRLGVVPQGAIGEGTMAALFEPDGPGAPAYLLTDNYNVILRYNCSNYYALSVGLLANAIAR